MEEYDFQHFAAQKVALHGSKEHLSVWRRDRESSPSQLLFHGTYTTILPECSNLCPNPEKAKKEYSEGLQNHKPRGQGRNGFVHELATVRRRESL